AEGTGEEQGNALFTATSCEETRFPWQRSAPAATRHAEALAALRAIPAGLFYPFDPATALHAGRAIECEGWPDASPGPAPTAAQPRPGAHATGAPWPRRPHPDGGHRRDRRPRSPGDRGHAAGRAGTAQRLELRRPARGLCQAHRLGGDPQALLVHRRRAAQRAL